MSDRPLAAKKPLAQKAAAVIAADEAAYAAKLPTPAFNGNAPNTQHPVFHAFMIQNRQYVANQGKGNVMIY